MKKFNLLMKVEYFAKINEKRKQEIVQYINCTITTIGLLCSLVLIWFLLKNAGNANKSELEYLRSLNATEPYKLQPRNPNCTIWNCLNIYRCGHRRHDHITVYVYPQSEFAEDNKASVMTREYYEILKAVVKSDFYTPNPEEACLFLPSIDLLNQNLINAEMVEKYLETLPYWRNGENHLLINMLPGSYPDFNRVLDVKTNKAIVLGGGFDSIVYRQNFDVAFPVWSGFLDNFNQSTLIREVPRKYFLIVGQLNLLPELRTVLTSVAAENPSDVLVLKRAKDPKTTVYPASSALRCNILHSTECVDYPNILLDGTFCIVGRSVRFGQPDFLEILAHNCIPVVVCNTIVLPFEDVIDWTLAAVRIWEQDIVMLYAKLRDISQERILEMRTQGKWLFEKYFRNLTTITLTALEVLNDRILPHMSRTKLAWNTIDNNYRRVNNPLFLPLIAPRAQGFTAVILTYDRVQSLFRLIQKLATVSSLQTILIIWNNQQRLPPPLSEFPKIMKPLKVIQTRENKLSNRFYPYDEIETEAILTIDDDIVMLTADEFDFGFEVWREFPDRIVGFPSRIHVWDNRTMRWRYESEWTNEISMVLTGVAFHHKYWSYMYTYAMPGGIKEWVDDRMNCEDIAMNFLIANLTNKPPIKVAPRKKFKCPECTSMEMLSADIGHMVERSECIGEFARIYGHMPLKSVEFRADPVLYKDNFPHKLKRYNDIGSL